MVVRGDSTGRIDLCTRSITQVPSYNRIELYQLDASRKDLLGFGASRAAVKDGVRGASILN